MTIKQLFPKSIWTKLRICKASIERAAFHILWIFPLDRTKIVFSNFNGKGYGDNPKYIAEEFLKRGKRNLYWLANGPEGQFPKGIKPLKYGSLCAFYHVATAGIWIDNNRKEPYVAKRKNQFYLQTWHGSIALKKIEQDSEDSLDCFYKMCAKRDSSMIDLMISDSLFSDRLYSNSFWYSGEVKRLGTPRLDALFDNSDLQQIRAAVGITSDQYVVLYAPTFRNNGDYSVYDINLEAVKSIFEEKTGKQVVILVRMHPHIPTDAVQFDHQITKDVSNYPDAYDLMKVSDVLITDYSSLIFEFPVAIPKPVFAYAKDKENYDRGFYFQLESLPFSFARSNEELFHIIRNFDQEKYEKNLSTFYQSIELVADGKASAHVVDFLLEEIETEIRKRT